MNKKQEKITWLIDEINKIIKRVTKQEKQYADQLAKIDPRFEKSARNLIHYRGLRLADISSVQKKLGHLGLSRLAKSQGHVMASLLTNKAILQSMLGQTAASKRPNLSFKKSAQLERYNAKALLGYRSKGRRTRIMVTLPSEAAENYQMVYNMILEGMNCARINCAHDDEIAWAKMVRHVRKASEKLQRRCKVTMDLGGPKIRTGALVPGPKIRKFRPRKDSRGVVTDPCKVWIGPNLSTDKELMHLPMELGQLGIRQKADLLFLRDARNKKRTLIIQQVKAKGCVGHVLKTTYIETGTKLYTDPKFKTKPLIVGDLPAIESALLLEVGDKLRLHQDATLGENKKVDAAGKVIAPAHLSCTLSNIAEQVKVGESIFFDDGKIEGLIRKVKSKEIIIEIVHAKGSGSKLKADKGINLPTSDLTVRGLTEKDKKDLRFVVEHADVVNLSFVNRPQDVRDLFAEMKRLNAPEGLGVILKIETQNGFNQLTDILLEAMQIHPVGLMIARGDLAIECGWNNIGRVQEEILSLCQAANIPAVWATQVLENLSKQGIPSRAEITDAAMAQRADGVMLNKGPYILRSIHLLDTILKDMAPYQDKSATLLPILEQADIHRL